MSIRGLDPESESAEAAPNLSPLVSQILEITPWEDRVIRKGTPKVMSRSLLFFAAQNVGTATYVEDGRQFQLYDLPINKPSELAEAQEALSVFAEIYNQNPVAADDDKALEALAEVADVAYNMAQLVGEPQFVSTINSFQSRGNMFEMLLLIAKLKYTYRYVDIDAVGLIPEGIVAADYTQAPVKDRINQGLRPDRKKDIPYELEQIIKPALAAEPGYWRSLLIDNWDNIIAMLDSVYSRARTVARRIDSATARETYQKGLLEQLLPSLDEMPQLRGQEMP